MRRDAEFQVVVAATKTVSVRCRLCHYKTASIGAGLGLAHGHQAHALSVSDLVVPCRSSLRALQGQA